MNPAEFENLAKLTVQPCGNRRSLSEGSEIFKLDGQDPASVQPVETVDAGYWLDRSGRSTSLSTVDGISASISPAAMIALYTRDFGDITSVS